MTEHIQPTAAAASGAGKRSFFHYLLLLLPWPLLLGISLANGAALDPHRIAETGIFSLLVLVISWTTQRRSRNLAVRELGSLLALGIGAWAVARPQLETWMDFALTAILLAEAICLAGWVWGPLSAVRRLGGFAAMALLAGGAVLALAQIETRFSEEEFFAAVSAGQLALYWLALLAADRARQRLWPLVDDTPALPARRQFTLWLLALGIAVLAIWTVDEYQNSFYGEQPPQFAGITAGQPFLCGEAAAPAETITGNEIHRRLIAQVSANPRKGPLELGLLALVEPEAGWPEQFKASLMQEARQGLYTGPAYSVKYGQCLASHRVYTYSLVRREQPDLFSPDEQAEIAAWMAAVNRRALTVEPVDWFYGLAFRDWPDGPYENQECGAALLAILEAEGLADPALSTRNRLYLGQQPRGWQRRFRNNDDAYLYQLEWLRNAYYQSFFDPQIDARLKELAFEWFLLQSLPDGSPLGYNHVVAVSAAQAAYWAAAELGRPDFLWLAGRSIEYAGSRPLGASPGMHQAVEMDASPPDWGSCLLYGQSGLPTRTGPLAPDKIVLRGGWQADDLYLLLNLRFTGWHRYKATNTVSLVYQGAALAGEDSRGETFAWLPVGRSLFRDKRIPRQNLNGLQVPRYGLDQVLYRLLGAGGPWAQDPPFYARVEQFEAGPDGAVSATSIDDWHGWQQTRRVHFVSSGAVVIVDEVRAPAAAPAEIAWHLANPPQVVPAREPGAGGILGRYTLRSGDQPAEMVLVSRRQASSPLEVVLQAGAEGEMSALAVRTTAGGSFSVATVFLTQEWAGAQVTLDAEGETVVLASDGQRVEVPWAWNSR